MASDDWLTDDNFTPERVANEIMQSACSGGLPWTGDHPEEDHGHTSCMWIGIAAQMLRGRDALIAEARAQGAADERAAVVAWLRSLDRQGGYADEFVDALEAGKQHV